MNNEITLGQALDIAVEKQKKGRLQEAEDIYRNILEKYPESHNALHLLGLIKYQKVVMEMLLRRLLKLSR